MRSVRLLAVLAFACCTSGCYVASISGLADAASSTVDDALLGHWQNAEEETEVVVERAEWHSYEVVVRTHGAEARFTGRTTQLGATRMFELTVHSGTDPGIALVPVHLLGRVSLRDEALVVELLDPDWFRARVNRRSLTTPALLDDRETVLLTAPRAQLRRWLTARLDTPAMFTEWATLNRSPGRSEVRGAR